MTQQDGKHFVPDIVAMMISGPSIKLAIGVVINGEQEQR
jgi:hypothetical protein